MIIMTTPQWYCDLIAKANAELANGQTNDCDDIIDYNAQYHQRWYNDLVSKANVEIETVENVEYVINVDDYDVIDYNAQQNFGYSNQTSEIDSYENQT